MLQSRTVALVVRAPLSESSASLAIYENDETVGVSRLVKVKVETYNTLCKVEDICFINVIDEKEDKSPNLEDRPTRIVISRVCGIPIFLSFSHRSIAASFVSALNGYYRLTEKWSVDLCDEFGTPSLKFLTT